MKKRMDHPKPPDRTPGERTELAQRATTEVAPTTESQLITQEQTTEARRERQREVAERFFDELNTVFGEIEHNIDAAEKNIPWENAPKGGGLQYLKKRSQSTFAEARSALTYVRQLAEYVRSDANACPDILAQGYNIRHEYADDFRQIKTRTVDIRRTGIAVNPEQRAFANEIVAFLHDRNGYRGLSIKDIPMLIARMRSLADFSGRNLAETLQILDQLKQPPRGIVQEREDAMQTHRNLSGCLSSLQGVLGYLSYVQALEIWNGDHVRTGALPRTSPENDIAFNPFGR